MDKISELRKKLISSAKKKVQERYEERDVHIIKAIKLLEDIDASSNLLIEQLREWHGVHFPELSEIVHDNEKYLSIVKELGNRKNFTHAKLTKTTGDAELAEKIAEAAKNSIGADAGADDLKEMTRLAENCYALRKEREQMAQYIESAMERELPIFTQMCGPVLGAKMLAKAGSKKKLAFMPASRLQLIGAEKALFLHFRGGIPGPKYGYLYSHPLVQGARDYFKGKIARTLAGKLSIAAKKDYFGSKDGADELIAQLEERVKTLSEGKEKPKVKKARPEGTGFDSAPPQGEAQAREPKPYTRGAQDERPNNNFRERRREGAEASFSARGERPGFERKKFEMGNFMPPRDRGFGRDGGGFRKKSFGGPRKFGGERSFGPKRSFGDRKPFGSREGGFSDRGFSGPRRSFGDRKPFGNREGGFGGRSFGERKSFGGGFKRQEGRGEGGSFGRRPSSGGFGKPGAFRKSNREGGGSDYPSRPSHGGFSKPKGKFGPRKKFRN